MITNTLYFPVNDWANKCSHLIEILIKPMKIRDSTSTSSAVGSQRLKMDLEDGKRPYSLEKEFVEGRSQVDIRRAMNH